MTTKTKAKTKDKPGYKLHTLSAALVATFFGTPIGGSFIIHQNLTKLGLKAEAKKYVLGAVIYTVILLVIFLFLDVPDKIAKTLSIGLTGGHVLIIKYYYEKSMAGAFKHHVKQGGEVYKWWSGAVMGVLVFVALLFLTFITLFVLDLAGLLPAFIYED